MPVQECGRRQGKVVAVSIMLSATGTEQVLRSKRVTALPHSEVARSAAVVDRAICFALFLGFLYCTAL